MKFTIVGCGDAFGSGGRLMTTYVVDAGGGTVLLDAGATVTVGLNRLGRDPNGIGHVLLSHLHGDHYAGVVWLLIQALYVTKRTAPLTVVGPPGVADRVLATAELLFPGCTKVKRAFDLRFEEIVAGTPRKVGSLEVTAFEVEHPSGAPSHALRMTHGAKILAFTGDTQWTEPLVACGSGADLYVMECYKFGVTPIYHMSWTAIAPHLDRIAARRVLLTHMSDEMLANRDRVTDARVVFAEDGLVLDV